MVIPDQLVSQYPILYHMAEDASWPSIRENGLLSTRALLDLFDITGSERDAIYSSHRPASIELHHPTRGSAVVRDQLPMPEVRLAPCLEDGISVREWYELINDRVFFWVSEHRLQRLLSARAYRNRVHTVLQLDTRSVVTDFLDKIQLTAINSGNTLPVARPRGKQTFRSIEDYPYDEIRRRRPARDSVVELAVEYAVRPVTDYVLKVERRHAADVLETIDHAC